jgi:hypothetical protein
MSTQRKTPVSPSDVRVTRRPRSDGAKGYWGGRSWGVLPRLSKAVAPRLRTETPDPDFRPPTSDLRPRACLDRHNLNGDLQALVPSADVQPVDRWDVPIVASEGECQMFIGNQ